MARKHDEPGPAQALRQRGLTLIELCVTMAIAAIVISLAVPSFTTLIDARRLDGAATRLAADVQFARSEALARNRSMRLTISAGTVSTCWIVHTGAAADCACASGTDGASVVCSGSAVAIKSVGLPNAERVRVAANVASIVFDPLHGTSTPTGTLRLESASGRAIHHVVNVLGRVRSCASGGAVVGYPAC